MIDQSLKKANILIVDDQEANIEILRGLLELQGYENVLSTTDPRQATELIASFNPDLMLLDLMMPFLSGFEILEHIKKIVSPNGFFPILVLTADATKESKQRALSDGATDFLTKPFDLIEVGLRIKNLLYTNYLHQQLRDQNLILEEKVRVRTAELERKNEELVTAKEKAEAGDRLKSSFIRNISHEIRTPLNGIVGLGEILTNSQPGKKEKKELLKMLNESTERLINVVTNFMDISKLSSGNQPVRRMAVYPQTLIEDVVHEYKKVHSCGHVTISVIKKTDHDKLQIYSDPDMLRRILYHLIDNAVKFTSKGTVKIGYTQKTTKKLLFYVKDNGIGISENSKTKIFDYFRQEEISNTRKYEGSGLGLPIAKGFVELLDGKIWVDSMENKGTTFYFTQPVVINPLSTNKQ